MTDDPRRTHFGCDALLDVEALNGVPSIVVDVGANVGQTAWAVHQRWPAAHVWCFEPAPAAFTVLMSNVAPLPHVTCRKEAVGAQPGVAAMAAADAAESNTLRVEERRDQALISVEVTTVDRVLTELPTPRIDLLKVDTEGFEFEVLRGARHALANHLVELVLLECDFVSRPGWPHGDFLTLHRELTAVGYRLVSLYTHGVDGEGWVWGDALWTKPRPSLPQLTSPLDSPLLQSR
jgi:FkbM family methyltransferase